jgi:hypothetical protein
MLSKVCSAAVNGLDADPVEVEAYAGYGDTFIVLMGLSELTVKKPHHGSGSVRLAWR